MCDFGFNGFKDETSVGLSYKSLDYMDYGLALINSTKEDTWNLINENQAGLNYFADDVDSLINNLVNLAPEDVLLMKKILENYLKNTLIEECLKVV
ncbi:hypothetical protein B481_1031 [Planococcus halocryophilus Or1]|nr:hypothetical protein B481_1031 [Planococcus halocryophilus Or1]